MHNIMYFTFNSKFTLKNINTEVVNYVKSHGDRYGTEFVSIPTSTVFESYEKAEEYIQCIDKGDYDGYAVRYLDYSDIKKNSKIEEIEGKILETNDKKAEYIRSHSIKTQKSAYIGCSECGSKLNRECLRSEKCPVCYTDLRAESTLSRIASYDKRIKDYQDALYKEKTKDKKKAKEMWLVKFEYHS